MSDVAGVCECDDTVAPVGSPSIQHDEQQHQPHGAASPSQHESSALLVHDDALASCASSAAVDDAVDADGMREQRAQARLLEAAVQRVPTALQAGCLLVLCVCSALLQLSMDLIAALATDIAERLGMGPGGVGLLVALYSLAGPVCGLFGGPLFDRVGVYGSCIAMHALLAVAVLMQALGCQYVLPVLVGAGRVLAGFAYIGELVCSNAMLSAWFSARAHPFATACYLTSIRVGSLVVFLCASWAKDAIGLLPLMFGVAVLDAVGCAATVAMALGGRRMHARYGLPRVSLPHVRLRAVLRALRLAAPVGVLVSCVFGTNSALFALAKNMVVSEWPRLSPGNAGVLLASVYAVTGVLALVCGALVRRFGQRAWMAVLGLGFQALALWLLALHVSAEAGFVLAGVGLAAGPAGLWPSLALLARGGLVATAFGAVFAVESLSIFGLITGATALVQAESSSVHALMVLAGVASFGFVFALVWSLHDWRTRGPLNAPPPAAGPS